MARKRREILKWNFERAWRYFEAQPTGKYIPEVKEYIDSMASDIETIDIRKRSSHEELTKELKSAKTFVLVDGPSNSGKSTFAQRLAMAVDAEVVDIDGLCAEYILNSVQNCKSKQEYVNTLLRMNSETSEYIKSKLEDIVKTKAKEGKTVILVGMYIDTIYRCILSNTIGKRYFDRTVSLFCLEQSFTRIERMIESRNSEFNMKKIHGEYQKVQEQYNLAKEIAEEDNGIFLTFGMNSSYLVSTRVSDWYKENQ